jgi:hypothetical protein
VEFDDTGGFRIADMTCPVHGPNGINPGDGYWDMTDEVSDSPVVRPDPCWCCGGSVLVRDPDPWGGRLDGYCEKCALARCDAFPGDCGHSRRLLADVDALTDEDFAAYLALQSLNPVTLEHDREVILGGAAAYKLSKRLRDILPI